MFHSYRSGPGRVLCTAFAAMACLCLVGVPELGASAAEVMSQDRADHAKRKINLAGRQRMLSQRIAMLSCMADAGVMRESSVKKAASASDLFQATFDGLNQGNAAMGLEAEEHPVVIASLDVVAPLWRGYRYAIDRYLAEGNPDDLRLIRSRNPAVLVNMNKSVQQMEQVYGAGLISEEIAMALNVAGRQRMLIMKAVKEACMVSRDFDAAADRDQLGNTLIAFEAAQVKLRDGSPQDRIIAPPSFEIESQMELTSLVWDWMSPRLRAIRDGQSPDPTELRALLLHAEVALTEMNAAVWLYENY